MNGYLENTEVQEMTKKAKENKTTKVNAGDKTKRKKREYTPKVDETKEQIVSLIAETLDNAGFERINITNKAKYIEFELNGEHFTVNLIKNRKK